MVHTCNFTAGTLVSACISFILAAGLSLVASDGGPYNEDVLEENCVAHPDDRIVNTSNAALSTYGFVRATRNNFYKSDLNCSMRVVAPPGYQLYVRINWLDIYKEKQNRCSPSDYLELSGYNNSYVYCGNYSPYSSFVTFSSNLTVLFLSGTSSSTNGYRGFEFYYTAFRTGECSVSSTGQEEFDCYEVNRCISNAVTCDDVNNCGDWTDESIKLCGLSTEAIILLAFCIGPICVIIVAISVHIIYNRVKKKRQTTPSSRSLEQTSRSETTSSPDRNSLDTDEYFIYELANGDLLFPNTLENTNLQRYAEPPPPYTFFPTQDNGQMNDAETGRASNLRLTSADRNSASDLPPPYSVDGNVNTVGSSEEPAYDSITDNNIQSASSSLDSFHNAQPISLDSESLESSHLDTTSLEPVTTNLEPDTTSLEPSSITQTNDTYL